jgi:hypothetical protein
MQVGIEFSVNRLKEKNISCIQPEKVVEAGAV